MTLADGSPIIATTDGQSDAEGLLAQLTALATEDGAHAQNASPTATTTGAALSAARSNAGLASALRNNSALDTDTAGPNTGPSVTTSSSAASTAVVSNESGTANGAQKMKSAALEVAVTSPIQTSEPISTTLDGAGSTSIINGTEVATPANDLASRAPQLTPQTIPMLAATMMRRLESGARQFTMRLDPPELGQVEVKLTVAADKKVRAVVSADRPEALADLIRSARDLARALLEAGLDLDENGLTFTLNDPSSGGQQQQAHDHNNGLIGERAPKASALADIDLTPPAHKLPTRSDPFQSWQRARIVLTA